MTQSQEDLMKKRGYRDLKEELEFMYHELAEIPLQRY